MSSSNPHLIYAIIMDGNGRWAKQRVLKEQQDTKKVLKVVQKYYKTLCKNGVKFNLYAFSTEKLDKTKLEVEYLMKLLEKYLKMLKHLYKIILV